jgi:hypothetical protein
MKKEFIQIAKAKGKKKRTHNQDIRMIKKLITNLSPRNHPDLIAFKQKHLSMLAALQPKKLKFDREVRTGESTRARNSPVPNLGS